SGRPSADHDSLGASPRGVLHQSLGLIGCNLPDSPVGNVVGHQSHNLIEPFVYMLGHDARTVLRPRTPGQNQLWLWPYDGDDQFDVDGAGDRDGQGHRITAAVGGDVSDDQSSSGGGL